VIFAWTSLDCDPLIYTSHVAGFTGINNHNWLLRWGLPSFMLVLASKCDPLNLCLLSSWDYRHEPCKYALMRCSCICFFSLSQSPLIPKINSAERRGFGKKDFFKDTSRSRSFPLAPGGSERLAACSFWARKGGGGGGKG
jgi:hypothetical protein